MFSKDVRKQLCQIIQKIAKGELVQEKYLYRFHFNTKLNSKLLLCVLVYSKVRLFPWLRALFVDGFCSIMFSLHFLFISRSNGCAIWLEAKKK